MTLKAIIVEDEQVSRDILRNYIAKYCQDIKLLGEAENIIEAQALIKKHGPDLVFLDIEMPFGNAFDLLEKFPDRTFETVIVTAFDHYAIEALNTHVAYYLMKPIDIEELVKSVDHVKDIKDKENKLAETILNPKKTVLDGKITIPQQDGFEVLNTSDIFFCKADDNYTEIYFKEKKIVVSKTLRHFEDILSAYGFVRVHKSYVVNLQKIQKYKRGKGGSLVLVNGKELMVSANRKRELLSYFG